MSEHCSGCSGFPWEQASTLPSGSSNELDEIPKLEDKGRVSEDHVKEVPGVLKRLTASEAWSRDVKNWLERLKDDLDLAQAPGSLGDLPSTPEALPPGRLRLSVEKAADHFRDRAAAVIREMFGQAGMEVTAVDLMYHSVRRQKDAKAMVEQLWSRGAAAERVKAARAWKLLGMESVLQDRIRKFDATDQDLADQLRLILSPEPAASHPAAADQSASPVVDAWPRPSDPGPSAESALATENPSAPSGASGNGEQQFVSRLEVLLLKLGDVPLDEDDREVMKSELEWLAKSFRSKRQRALSRWDSLRAELDRFCGEHPDLREVLDESTEALRLSTSYPDP